MGFKFGDFVKYELVRKKIKAIDLAEAINKSPAYITKLQKQNFIPEHNVLKIIAKKFEISYEFLLYQIGIIDEYALLHINAFTTLKGYLSEVMNINDMSVDKIEKLMKYMKDNKEKLDKELDDKLILEVKNTLGESFVFPKYEDPYAPDSFYGFKKINNLKIATGEIEKHVSNIKELPVYKDFDDNGNDKIISKVKVDLNFIKADVNFNNEIVWYKPFVDKDYYYLIEKNAYNNGDKILFKQNDDMFIGKYTVNMSNTTMNSVIISNIVNVHSEKEKDTPIFFMNNDIPDNLRIIGRIISEFKSL